MISQFKTNRLLLNPVPERQGESEDLRHSEARGRDALVPPDDPRRRLRSRDKIQLTKIVALVQILRNQR